MSTSAERLQHFSSSLSALANVAFQMTPATGFALFERSGDGTGLHRVAGSGAEIPARAVLERSNLRLVRFPLRSGGRQDGLAVFSFADASLSAEAREPLSRLRESLEIIWAARLPDSRLFELVAGISTLEARIMDSKIADRAYGLLEDESSSDVLDAMVRHVETVVRPNQLSNTLESTFRKLEDELEGRRVTGEAKAVLQARYSLSENQAYAHLRVLSRKTRRPLRDVAKDVIATSALSSSAA